jgi:hypothetical protein
MEKSAAAVGPDPVLRLSGSGRCPEKGTVPTGKRRSRKPFGDEPPARKNNFLLFADFMRNFAR